jgi:hypothetical protein
MHYTCSDIALRIAAITAYGDLLNAQMNAKIDNMLNFRPFEDLGIVRVVCELKHLRGFAFICGPKKS